MNNRPLISIITVCLNSEKTIEETILSVINQTYNNVEYIIIDGGSLDGTREIINKYKNKINYLVSEKDDGLYFAFNKGIKFVNGEMFGYVNSDDILMPNAIETLVKYYNQNRNVDFIFGSVKKHWGVLHGYKPWKINFTWNFYSSHSTGFFIKTTSAKKIGPYNTNYKYTSDWEYLYRAIKKFKLKGIATKKEELFGIFRRGGFSSRVSPLLMLFETTKIRLEHGQNKIIVLIIFILKFLRNYYKY
jgi:glycosyltransferase involved in cell wall biosynthesis